MGRYDNLHGDEDLVEYTYDELYDMECEKADQLNDELWLEERE